MDFSALYSRISPETLARQAGRELYADAASKAANTKVYQRVVDSALVGLQEVAYADSASSSRVAVPGRPQLAAPAPRAGRGKESAQDKFVLLMASLISLLSDASMESLKARMAVLKEAAANGSALAEKYHNAVAESEAAVSSASASEERLSAAKANLEQAQKDLADAQETLDKVAPGTPEHQKAVAARDLAQGKVNDARQRLTGAEKEHVTALGAAADALKNAEALAKQIESSGTAGPSVIEGAKAQLNASSTMVLLMMKCAELMGDSAENKIDAEQELFRTMQAARQAYLEEKAVEYAEQVKQAEAASKTMGCIGKIVGAVLTVVSVVGAAFTGGASLALAVVGIGLMGADMLSKELTGVSFMEEAMKPLMESVLQPMMEAIGKGIADVLESMGVDQKSAEMAGMVLGAVIGAAAMLATLAVVAVVGKSAAGRIAGMMGKMLGKMVSKMVPDLLKQASRAVSKGFTSVMTKARTSIGLKSDANSLGMYSARLGQGVAVVEAGSVTAQSALGVEAGIHRRDAANALADAKLAMAISESMKEWLGDMVQLFDQAMNAAHVAITKAVNVQAASESAALSMARNI
ncbi:type III secretion system translocon subunit SctE [Pseudomonas chlororaphis]|uniref:type III secretion system translocon subunit SctE n=1 Tax=Pseudomonas chlororaphis TaxID=587753 RepID=UPI0030CFF851